MLVDKECPNCGNQFDVFVNGLDTTGECEECGLYIEIVTKFHDKPTEYAHEKQQMWHEFLIEDDEQYKNDCLDIDGTTDFIPSNEYCYSQDREKFHNKGRV